MADELVTAFADFCRYLGRIIIDRRIHQMAHRQPHGFEQVENTPNTHAQTVIAPRIVSHVGLGAGIGRRVAKPFAKTEMLNIKAEIDSEALAFGPVVIWPFRYR